MIFGEFTPLIVYLFGSSFLPLTVITPGQLDKRRRKRIDDLDRKRLPIVPRVTPTVEQVKQLQKRTIIHECRYSQKVVSSNSRLLGVFPRWMPIHLFPTIYLREKLIRQVNYLEYDDELLRKDCQKPGFQDLSLDEVKMALEERGVYDLF